MQIMKWQLLSVSLAVSAVMYCELIADYVALFKCSWPGMLKPPQTEETVRALILADTHLIGPIHGHWLDRLYREWHMRQAFSASLTLLKPDVVFALGDLFDEGFMVDHTEFKSYVERFKRIFNLPTHIPLISAVGNHDIGFHYKMHSYLINRFQENFNNTGVHMYTFKQVHFVIVNSMAMQNDGCSFCERSLRDLHKISNQLRCYKDSRYCKDATASIEQQMYSRPVLMQHFPTYRHSDRECREHDADEIYPYRGDWEVLSQEATALLGNLLHPRVAFAGHSHHYCMNVNQLGIEEYTAASFNWRNKINPSILLAEFTPKNHSVVKCHILTQTVVYNIYCLTAIFLIFIYALYRSVLRVSLARAKQRILNLKSE